MTLDDLERAGRLGGVLTFLASHCETEIQTVIPSVQPTHA